MSVSTVAATVTTASAPAGITPTGQVRLEPVSEQPPLGPEPVIAVMPAGRVSVTVTPCASDGPALVMVSVQLIC